jgi:hypothetical protein
VRRRFVKLTAQIDDAFVEILGELAGIFLTILAGMH